MDKLKPCPFCGHKAKLKQSTTGYNGGHIINTYHVICEKCEIDTSRYCSDIYQDEKGEICVNSNGAEKAISTWNHRESENTE